MQWIRIVGRITMTLVVVPAMVIMAAIALMWASPMNSKSMVRDPAYNNTYWIMSIILATQTCLIFCSLPSALIKLQNHSQKNQGRILILGLLLWTTLSLVNLGAGIFSILKGAESQQDGMDGLFEIFSQNGQDAEFLAQFEKYQTEKTCCGIYGPDDWLMVILKNEMNGKAGGSYQVKELGLSPSLSIANCPLAPATDPAGCGPRILEGIHNMLTTMGGVMVAQSVMALASSGLLLYYFVVYSKMTTPTTVESKT